MTLTMKQLMSEIGAKHVGNDNYVLDEIHHFLYLRFDIKDAAEVLAGTTSITIYPIPDNGDGAMVELSNKADVDYVCKVVSMIKQSDCSLCKE